VNALRQSTTETEAACYCVRGLQHLRYIWKLGA